MHTYIHKYRHTHHYSQYLHICKKTILNHDLYLSNKVSLLISLYPVAVLWKNSSEKNKNESICLKTLLFTLVNDTDTLRPSTHAPSICSCSPFFPKKETHKLLTLCCVCVFISTSEPADQFYEIWYEYHALECMPTS